MDQERYRSLVEASPDAILLTDLEGKILMCNQQTATMHGVGRIKDVIGRNAFELVAPEDRQRAGENMFKTLKEGLIRNLEYTCVRADGSRFPAEMSVSVILDEAGQPQAFMAIVRDITARKQAEIALRESEDRFRSVIEQSRDGITLFDEQGVVVTWNQAQERITGIQRAEAIGQLAWEAQFQALPEAEQSPERHDQLQAALQAFFQTGQAPWLGQLQEATIRHSDGSQRILQQSSFRIQTAKGFMLGAINRDITEQRRAQDDLRKLSQAVEQSANTVVITDLEGNIEYANPKFEATTGYTVEEALGQNPRILKSGDHPESHYRELWETITAGRVWQGEFHNKRKDGTLYWEHATIAPVYDSAGRMTCFIAVKEDITVRKQMEKALRESRDRYALATHAARVGVWDWNVQTGEFYLDPNVKAILGYSDEEIPNDIEIWAGYVHPDDRQAAMDAFQAHIEGQTPEYVYEHRMWHKDGSVRWILARGTAIRDAQGDAVRVVGTDSDITTQKRVEEALRKSEALLNKSQSIAHIGAWELDIVADRLAWSDEVYRMFGLHPQEFEATYEVFLDTVHPDDRAAVDDAYSGSLREGRDDYEIEHRIVRRDSGAVRVVHEKCQHVRDASGRIVRSVGIVQDITERVRAEERLRSALVQTETLRQSVAVVAATLDVDEAIARILQELERVVAHDSASVQLLREGYLQVIGGRGWPDLEEVIGLRFPVPGDNPNTIVVRERQVYSLPNAAAQYPAFRTGVHSHIQSWLGVPLIVRGRVRGILALDSTQPHHFGDDDAQMVQAFADQVAIALENARLHEQTRRDAEIKATLLREVNHRVSNNLSAIIGLLDLERTRSDVDQSTYEGVMDDLGNRVRGLAAAHRLLSAGEWSPLLLSELAEQVIAAALQALPSDKHISVEVAPSPLRVSPKAANNLALVLNELATNSTKYAWPERRSGRISVRVDQQDGMIVIEFRDDGAGYPQEVLELERHSVGWELIQTLIGHSMQGEITLSNEGGAVAIIRLPLRGQDNL